MCLALIMTRFRTIAHLALKLNNKSQINSGRLLYVNGGERGRREGGSAEDGTAVRWRVTSTSCIQQQQQQRRYFIETATATSRRCSKETLWDISHCLSPSFVVRPPHPPALPTLAVPPSPFRSKSHALRFHTHTHSAQYLLCHFRLITYSCISRLRQGWNKKSI